MHKGRKKEEGGEREKGTHSKASNFSPPCMLDVGVGECQRGRQRKVPSEGVSFILLSFAQCAH